MIDLSPRAEELYLAYFIETVFRAIGMGSLTDEEARLVAEICTKKLSTDSLSRFQKESLKLILSNLG